MLIQILPGGVGLASGVGVGVFSNGVDYAWWRNFMHFDPRLYAPEMRLVGFQFGLANRHFLEVPGFTFNIDFNVLYELVVVGIHPATGTSYGPVPTNFLNGGLLSIQEAEAVDPTAAWRASWQVRRGITKRWGWEEAIRLGTHPVTGFREALVSRLRLLQPQTNLPQVFACEMVFATSPEDVPAW